MRGLTARTDIYLDDFRDGFRDRGQYYRDTFNLESIDVLCPSSLYFGRGSTGASSVNKQPNLKLRADVSPCRPARMTATARRSM